MSRRIQTPLLCRPPRNFSPAGNISEVQWAPGYSKLIPGTRVRGVRAQGIRYERKAQQHFTGAYSNYVAGPWLRFRSGASAWRVCQPDGYQLDFRRGLITIFEFKLQHTALAWWQLRHLYEPVTYALLKNWDVAVLEVTRWFDPHTVFPERFKIIQDVEDVAPGGFFVHIWRP